MKSRFLTYASNGFEHNAQFLAESAAKVGFDVVHSLGPDAIAGTNFAQLNGDILRAKRGGGYWLWKPYLIRRYVDRLADGEVLFYCDAGRNNYYRFSRFPGHLADRALQSVQGFIPGVAIGHLGSIGKWTKRDCLQIMGADTASIYEKPMVQATWSVWTKSGATVEFLEAWLRYSQDPRCITDQPNTLGKENLPGFVDHRHDQSICSILAYQLSAPFIDPSGTVAQKLLRLRPGSAVANLFYKRPENVDDMLQRDSPWLPVQEFLSLRKQQ
ncbi:MULTISPECIES: hypothetical protein [unclassified Sulfitobacter]|uniref:hypothetical protein n=1 Tax=unclassified Sulfitobacter TaxID=196795 RepID=UPI0007C290B5|nr:MULTISPECIES: hypothetical protein [unclassified Sulfitobacter]KZY01809.1 hypothetical protein A3721_04705 [Sulfitobacter sp. HI0023]KZY26357.1 hypothetical protein A3728_16130 [Sulfitobacter sp. HI0040]KZZ68331.1 hypothetical protein A3764_13180 [Sulfitobacter sp. HI0129]